jgi:2-dehydro-3-deoxyphosphooctonate aldolase (KDO 8-P synthase)
MASALKEITDKYDVDFYFKASFDKANRTSGDSFRGPGLIRGVDILYRIKKDFGLKICTDIHKPEQAERASLVADIIQIPAFLCRQTDLIEAAAETGKIVSIKKGQFLAPHDMQHPYNKAKTESNDVWLIERGATFGYNNLVVDMRSFSMMKENTGATVIHDATHSMQLPGQGSVSGGARQYALPVAMAAVAAGADGIFAEVHDDPPSAKSDPATQLYLNDFEMFLEQLLRVRRVL